MKYKYLLFNLDNSLIDDDKKVVIYSIYTHMMMLMQEMLLHMQEEFLE